jgi:hypothetical protein
MKSVPACCLLLAATIAVAANGNGKPCTRQDAMLAEKEASSLQDWQETYRSYKKFAQCDDGAIGEGYSASVARLLGDKWGSVDQLNRLAARDKSFETFVLRHIDELMSPAQAKQIRDNAVERCPAHAAWLCGAIGVRITEVWAAVGSSPPNRR